MELSTCFASPEIYYSLACFTYILYQVCSVPSSGGATCAILIVNKATTSTLHAAK